jgi:hypothetical protein
MGRPYSMDLRERVVAAVEQEGMFDLASGKLYVTRVKNGSCSPSGTG